MSKLLIAVDGSDHARRAIEAAARLAPQTPDLETVLVNVRNPPTLYGTLPPVHHDAIEANLRQAQSELLAAALADARRSGLARVSTRAEVGFAAGEILRVADDVGADQIVMGTHGRGALGSLFLGSTAQRVVHLAKVPVLLVK